MADARGSFGRKPLPAFPGYLKLLGPGLVWMALAQGSGELIWWPLIVAKYGLAFLFLLIPACLLQFPLTFEIGRYTVLTGEGIFRGFFRLNKVFGILLWVLFTISFLWFGAFATAGGTAIAALTQFPPSWTPKARTLLWAQSSIVVFTIAILYAKVVYRLIEWVMKIVALIALLGMLFACAHPSVLRHLGEFLKGLFVPDLEAMRHWDPADATRLLTAITFAGLGGFWTLFYSYWIKEKGIGMAAHMEHMTGFRSGISHIRTGEAALPMADQDTAGRLGRWYRYLSFETLVGILGNLLTTLMTCLLAFALLHPEGILPEKYQVAVVQARFFEVTWGTLGKLVFLFVAGAFLVDTWLATVDCVSRIHLDAITTLWPRLGTKNLRPWYYGLVIFLAVVTSVTMFFEAPDSLILLNAVLGFMGTVTFSTALIFLNHRYLGKQLPASLRPSLLSRCGIILATGFYYVLAGLYLYHRIRYG